MANTTAAIDGEVAASDGDSHQYVTFYLADEVFGFSMASVLEIIRPPKTVPVPLTAPELLGLANLRGSVLPILDLRRVLQIQATDEQEDANTRVIVTDEGNPVGLLVDQVAQVMNVEPERIESTGRGGGSVDATLLTGVVKGREGEPLIQLLNVAELIGQQFADVLSKRGSSAIDSDTTAQTAEQTHEDDDTDQLVSFTVEGQEYAFPLMDVDEIVRIPETIFEVPNVDSTVLGLVDLRGRLLPLVSLRRMFSLTDVPLAEDNRVLVVRMPGQGNHQDSIGLVADTVNEVLRVPREVQDAMPTLLTEGDNATEISSICRLQEGKRLVSVLRAQAMFAHPEIQAAMESGNDEEVENVAEETDTDAEAMDDDTAQLVVFHLGEQEYGVNIDDVQEITRIPDKLDKVPKTDKFIEGMINLRGTVLPVLDMRVRFSMDKIERNDHQRIVVLSLEGIKTGFIVDAVAEVLRLPRSHIEAAPNLSPDQMRIMGQVVNIKDSKRMIQVLKVRELLNEQELGAVGRNGSPAESESDRIQAANARRKSDRPAHTGR